MINQSQSIYRELLAGPLLVGGLGEVSSFNRSLLNTQAPTKELHFDQKLGHLYEEALENLIQHSPKLECIARSLQVFDQTGRTIGELDFVLYDHVTKKHIHLELAVKFYLAIQKEGHWHYPGPDPRDNWLRKLKHMQTKQFPLSQRAEARNMLIQNYGIQKIETQQLIYGRIFAPESCSTVPTPHQVTRQASKGKWLLANELEQSISPEETVYLIPKPLWPIQLTEENRALFQPVDRGTLIQLSSERCTMFARRKINEPYFGVPETWLQDATNSS